MDDEWDNIMTGNDQLNHSEAFFDLRRDAKTKFTQIMNKENNSNINNQTICTKDLLKIVSEKTKKKHVEEPDIETLLHNIRTMGNSQEEPVCTRKPSSASSSSGATKKATSSKTLAPPQQRPPSAPAIPNAYKYAEIYKKKIAQKEERLRAQEREAREFKPRPLPDFKKAHQLMEKKRMELLVLPVCPETPPTLRRSTEAAARRQQMLEQKRLAEKVPDFKARPAEVLTCRPYKPVVPHREIESDPFDLQSGNRAVERKMYDEAYARAQEAKRLQEQQEAEEKEIELRKKLRKQKEFKARPNPFS